MPARLPQLPRHRGPSLQHLRLLPLSAEGHATDLRAARENQLRSITTTVNYSEQDLITDLEHEFGAGAVNRGRELFAQTCARCHSSQPDAAGQPQRRLHDGVGNERPARDWMGNDKPTPASEVGTFRCRALHSNHMTGHIWAEYGSETLRAQPPTRTSASRATAGAATTATSRCSMSGPTPLHAQ